MFFHPNVRNLVRLLSNKSGFRFYTAKSSVNASEVSHFDALASTWWDPHGPSRLLHLMNPLRHDFIWACNASHSTSATPPKNSVRYLDIGCGGGIFSESAARLSTTKSVTAIDPSTEVITVAKDHARQDPIFQEPGRLEYLNISIEDLPLPERPELQYDFVTLFEVIEHIDFPATFLSSSMPFVKPGGWLILSTIARTWPSWLTTKFIAEDVIRLVPRGTHEWGKYVDEEELKDFFRSKDGWGGEGGMRSEGVMYLPWIGWRTVRSGQRWGNYFFGVRNSNVNDKMVHANI
jgi:ubiquinone biosynthesis O-methyltransferase